MSKKMLKRSLALGALMAFAITGSALAAELTISSDAIFGKVKNGEEEYEGWYKSGKIYSVNSTSHNTLTIGNVSNVDKAVYVAYVSAGASDAKGEYNTLNINGDVSTSRNLIAAYIKGSEKSEAIYNHAVVSGDAEVNANVYASWAQGKNAITKENTITLKEKADVEGSVVAGYAYGNSTSKTVVVNTAVTNNTVNVKDDAKVNSVFGAIAEGKSLNNYIKVENNKVNIGENAIVDATDNNCISNQTHSAKVYGVYGAYVISISNDNSGNPADIANASATAVLERNSVDITGGTVTGNVYGGYAVAENCYGNASLDAQANSNKVNLSGGTIIGNVYGGHSIKITSSLSSSAEPVASTASNNEVNISGTVDVENADLFGNNGGEGEGNILNIKGGWEGSIGSAQNFNAINITEGAKATFKTALNDANVAVNVKGATWNVDKTNTVGSASFDASSVLSIDGATFEAKDSDNVYALNGSGELKVANGATLAIKGIDYKKYNVAEGFTSIVDGNGNKFADGDEYWKLENTLMEGVWTNDNGLQVQIKAKEAEDLAEDMGVSVNIANTMTEIINIANDKKGDITEGTPQADVVKFAEALADVAPEVAGQAVEAVVKMAEAGGNSATAANIVKNVTGVTNDRLSFNCGHSAPHKGGHGVGLFEEGSGADIWVEYVHGKDKVEDMKSTAGATSYEGQYNGFVMGVDFKKVNKFQSGIAFNYGEGDTNSVGTSSRTHSDYDFWGVGYYGNIHNDDSNVIFDINYAKTNSDVTNYNIAAGIVEASPETTTWTAGVKVEKLYQNENVQIVPYTGLRYMSIDPDDYKTKGASYSYNMERQDIWLLPLGVSIKQEVTNDNGWTVSPRVDLSYIWAFGDTDSNMGFGHALDNKITNIGYDVMDDGSFLGLVGIEAHKGQWGYGVAYSYQKGDHSESKKWYVDVNYSF